MMVCCKVLAWARGRKVPVPELEALGYTPALVVVEKVGRATDIYPVEAGSPYRRVAALEEVAGRKAGV